jgi:hypothetical protein
MIVYYVQAPVTLHAVPSVSRRLPIAAARSGQVGFVVEKAEVGQVFSEYFGFPVQAFHRLLHTRHHASSSGTGTLGHSVASVIVESVPVHPKKRKALQLTVFILQTK